MQNHICVEAPGAKQALNLCSPWANAGATAIASITTIRTTTVNKNRIRFFVRSPFRLGRRILLEGLLELLAHLVAAKPIAEDY
jgi:hypothetical protein